MTDSQQEGKKQKEMIKYQVLRVPLSTFNKHD